MSRKSTELAPRKVWRMSANAPLGEIVSIDPMADLAKPPPDVPQRDWHETDWQSSSFALLSGCQVKDYTERLPDRVFDALFKD